MNDLPPSAAVRTFRGGPIFDGTRLRTDHVVTVSEGELVSIGPDRGGPYPGTLIDLSGDILAPGFVDLQVNGGGGVMFNDAPSVATLRKIAAAHLSLGTTTFLPTLITDTPERTRAAISAVRSALAEDVQGIGGLHLEGPHLSLARKGAHDPALIRPMTGQDLTLLCEAARELPALLLTIAPESVTTEQVATLTGAGAIVSLGHTDADYETCLAYQAAGARLVTHLFNAMSQLGSRNPGLVGAALCHGGLSASLIADGIHVHPDAVRMALRSKKGPGAIFLVSDAMAPAGTDLASFQLNGREIRRAQGRLRLTDGTLAGADLDLTSAVGFLTGTIGLELGQALKMATSIPARLVRQPAGTGALKVGTPCRMVRLSGFPDSPVLRQVVAN